MCGGCECVRRGREAQNRHGWASTHTPTVAQRVWQRSLQRHRRHPAGAEDAAERDVSLHQQRSLKRHTEREKGVLFSTETANSADAAHTESEAVLSVDASESLLLCEASSAGLCVSSMQMSGSSDKHSVCLLCSAGVSGTIPSDGRKRSKSLCIQYSRVLCILRV